MSLFVIKSIESKRKLPAHLTTMSFQTVFHTSHIQAILFKKQMVQITQAQKWAHKTYITTIRIKKTRKGLIAIRKITPLTHLDIKFMLRKKATFMTGAKLINNPITFHNIVCKLMMKVFQMKICNCREYRRVLCLKQSENGLTLWIKRRKKLRMNLWSEINQFI